MAKKKPPLVLPENSATTEKKAKPGLNVPLSEAEQAQIVAVCQGLKNSFIANGKLKKQIMLQCYAYSKGKFIDPNDLLPVPSAGYGNNSGNANDAQTGRPKVFLPVTRELVKQLFAFLTLTIFPNDEDYFRVRAKDDEPIPANLHPNYPEYQAAEAMWIQQSQAAIQAGMMPPSPPPPLPPLTYVDFEDELTDGLMYVFKESGVPEKMSAALNNICQMGFASVYPTIRTDINYEYKADSEAGEWKANKIESDPCLDIENLDPLHFYVDPFCTDADRSKWCYINRKKIRDLQDNSDLYFNVDKLKEFASKSVDNSQLIDGINPTGLNDLQSVFADSEDTVNYDLYYFPMIETDKRAYRNMLVGVGADSVLVRFQPNLMPRGLNPVVFGTWARDPESPYGIGPVEDVRELQRLVNIMQNYMIDTLARIGNRFAVSPETDISNLFGVAGGVAVCQNPGQDIVAFTGDYSEIAAIQNTIGVHKAEMQAVAGSSNTFQGASNLDFKKTATEIQVNTENSMSIGREVVNHVSNDFVQGALERCMYLTAENYDKLKIRMDDTDEGPQFKTVDFRLLKTGKYTLELIAANPSQSKNAQVQGLLQLLQLMGDNPALIDLAEPILKEIGVLQGYKNMQGLLDQLKEKIHGQGQPGIPGAQGGMGTPALGGIPNVPAPNPGEPSGLPPEGNPFP